MPFAEGARYGIELFYPFENELRVHMRDGRLVFDGDFGPDPGTGIQWPPFRTFGETYYTYQILLDVKVEPGWAIRTEPHPRFYTDPTDTVPIAVPALLRHWWPMMFFIVFKSPAEGRTHIFRPSEPMAQIIVIPAEADFELVVMNEDEAAERELQARRIHKSRDTLATETRMDVFDEHGVRRDLSAHSERCKGPRKNETGRRRAVTLRTEDEGFFRTPSSADKQQSPAAE